jgi:hypothetical protein
VGTTALTNVDLHDLARAARCYGVEQVFIVTPIEVQRGMVDEVVDHWVQGEGSRRHPRRAEAMRLVTPAVSLAEVCERVAALSSAAPLVAVTSAAMSGRITGYGELRQRMRCEPGSLVLVFGTGWGLAPEVIEAADLRLPALTRDPGYAGHGSPYNHLSVRAAAAIVLDRLLGERG